MFHTGGHRSHGLFSWTHMASDFYQKHPASLLWDKAWQHGFLSARERSGGPVPKGPVLSLALTQGISELEFAALLPLNKGEMTLPFTCHTHHLIQTQRMTKTQQNKKKKMTSYPHHPLWPICCLLFPDNSGVRGLSLTLVLSRSNSFDLSQPIYISLLALPLPCCRPPSSLLPLPH